MAEHQRIEYNKAKAAASNEQIWELGKWEKNTGKGEVRVGSVAEKNEMLCALKHFEFSLKI